MVEVEALEFQVFDRYEEILCYVRVGGQPVERYVLLDRVGETHWDIAALLGGENSRRVALPRGQDLDVQMECGANAAIGEQWAHFDLGSFAQQHPPQQWDGQPITVWRSSGGEEGRFFRVTYRLCAGSCEETALPPPHLWAQQIFGGQRFLIWTWAGDPESIDGFRARYNCYHRTSGVLWRGATIDTSPDQWSRSIEQFEPGCRHTCEWSVWAYRQSDGVESPRSNIAVVDVGPCPVIVHKWVSVEFVELSMWYGSHEVRGAGPIYGDFYANDRVLSFDGADVGCVTPGRRLAPPHYCNYFLPSNVAANVSIARLFEWIQVMRADPMCSDCDHFAPSTTSVSLDLLEGEPLMIGFHIYEPWETGNRWLCYGEDVLSYDSVQDSGLDYSGFPANAWVRGVDNCSLVYRLTVVD